MSSFLEIADDSTRATRQERVMATVLFADLVSSIQRARRNLERVSLPIRAGLQAG
ncbi:MAG: hypothetical protein OEY55_11145 [Acidimicrobiia bacterium]|nr:hypothetical protein [Acidimicrobiia bacterium]